MLASSDVPPDRQSIRLRQRQSLLPAEPALGGHLQDLPEGGVEKTYNEIFALPPGGTSGLTAGRLPESRAYAAVVATGGRVRARRENAAGMRADSLWFPLVGRSGESGTRPLAAGPFSSPVAAVLDGWIYLAGGCQPGPPRGGTLLVFLS